MWKFTKKTNNGRIIKQKNYPTLKSIASDNTELTKYNVRYIRENCYKTLFKNYSIVPLEYNLEEKEVVVVPPKSNYTEEFVLNYFNNLNNEKKMTLICKILK